MHSNCGVGNTTRNEVNLKCEALFEEVMTVVTELFLQQMYMGKKKKTTCRRNSKTDDSCRKVGNQIAPRRDVMNADTRKMF